MVAMREFGQAGAIVQIRLKNFMTYSDVVLKPGSNLNMILGPNGTGKSAIVCAIIVGLAGEVSLTGRASTPAGLVKKGTDWCTTEIELFNDKGRNHVVTRKIIITGRSEVKIDHKSEWKLNGSIVKKAEVQNLISKLNIKVDNLCQFLPQDSVAAFVKMNPCELLTSTLRAAGNDEMVEHHKKLIDLTNSIEENKSRLKALKQECRDHEVHARRLESEVEKLKEREELVKQKKICSQKIHYVKYLEAKRDHDDAKSELLALQEELERIKSSSEPFQRQMKICQNEEIRLKTKRDKSFSDLEKIESLIVCSKNSIENRKLECQDAFTTFKGKQDEEKHREQSIKVSQQQLQQLECKLNELRDVDNSREIGKLQQEGDHIKKKIMQCQQDKSVIEEKRRKVIRDLDTAKSSRGQVLAIKDRRLSLMMHRRPDAFKVVEWLTRNQHKFKKKVYLPILCEINVKDPKFKNIIEHAIPESDLMSFVCESEEDLRTLTRLTRQELNAKINVILMPDKSLAEFERDFQPPAFLVNNPTFRGFLKDLIEAPEPIMRYLCGAQGFHLVPALGECSESDLKNLLSRLRKFYVGSKFFNITKSRYDQQIITTTDTIRDARYLIYSLDKERLEQLEREIKRHEQEKESCEREQEHINSNLDNLKREWQAACDNLNKLRSEQEERKRIQTKIDICRNQLETLMGERIDLQTAKIGLQESIKKINNKLIADLVNLRQNFVSLIGVKKTLLLTVLLYTAARKNFEESKKKFDSTKTDTTRLNEAIVDANKKVATHQRELAALATLTAEKVTGFKNGKLNKDTAEKFASIVQDTYEELSRFIEGLNVRIINIGRDANNALMHEFNRQKNELNDKRVQISQLEADIELLETNQSEIKDDWIRNVDEILVVVDEHYRAFMARLNYGGEVSLDFDPSNPNDFASYGIMIKVRYRENEQLIPLCSTRQSGGERSVATMIYMLALQSKTTVPFRCVDEINQGMDKNNERKVFELLVQTADESSSQYFLVSPKLLSNLPYSEKMCIHIVFNGKRLDMSWDELDSGGEHSGTEDNSENDEPMEVQ